jgi:hypothetical protein
VPAVLGKICCPLRPASMTLDRDRPRSSPPGTPACCTQQTLTVPPDVLAKTAQKHDYPAANDTTRGWCQIMGLAPRLLFTTCLIITRDRITAA